MVSDRETLISFGFAPDRVDWALKATAGRGLQPAMDFLLENESKPVPDLNETSEQPNPAGGSGGPGEEDDEEAAALREALGLSVAAPAESGESSSAGGAVQSIKCSQCGKIFRDMALANFHAEKSGHDQFEESTDEIKPLTEEEKKQRLAELKERMAKKRAVKAEEDAKDAKANEALRRKAGKDAGAAREELKIKELEKEALRKRQEKLDDAKAKAAIKAQIEADKRERAEKAAREKALREGREYIPSNAAGPSSPSVASPTTAEKSGTKGSDYKDTRLQIRLSSGGPPLTTTLPSTSKLEEVAEFVASQSLAYNVDNITFAMQFPRRTFSRTDFSKSLKDLGLTPSAVLLAS
ncbi:hypothetical protein FRC02_004652 [Tulasnella sp. 418]|nr:hypothetical protein FRC02_004652 [Tulasnella sp. 418]